MQCWAGGLSQQCPSSLPNRTGCGERACPQPAACQQSRRSQQALGRGLHKKRHRSRAQPEAVAGSLPADARTGLPDLPAPELPAAAQGKSLGSLALRVIFGTALGAVGLVVITGGGWTFTLAVCLIVYQATQVRHGRPCPPANFAQKLWQRLHHSADYSDWSGSLQHNELACCSAPRLPAHFACVQAQGGVVRAA